MILLHDSVPAGGGGRRPAGVRRGIGSGGSGGCSRDGGGSGCGSDGSTGLLHAGRCGDRPAPI